MLMKMQEKMKLPPERVAELNMRRREYKWSLILAQVLNWGLWFKHCALRFKHTLKLYSFSLFNL